MGADWLAERRTEAAAERILDAAAELFTRRDAASVGMNDIASAAGCSRATLYRYFENRDVLFSAYVHRETHRVFAEIGSQLAGVTDPGRRVVEGALAALHKVRENPALASWFASTTRPIGAELAERSEVIATLVQAFLASLGDGTELELRARWLVRVLISLLQFPGRDDGEERLMLERFVAPHVAPSVRTDQSQAAQ
ncbi:TetR/AcrR family transcriptional regulator [Mycolicibacterium diernhoferi]|uniref:TetR family transcriptional regulator n=1 Tax=Mycolicibacterium diernhoferi TaxID=1801 RepID=A0A1Q4H8I8_9MYCO|nr:TetR/AcrR family transcriptional regulator [Mycolicibacterium diernhoferi]OJZ63827.1 TetR family transcriptional regulator [Mycolicibacterium diernhoferi]OPE54081.1 TetR family transcriptional regulator [Mycolicibacterium diernhoferi]PEG54317.1 TetR/AcrR family transcriptional regulator [Mycolicibacterium diernhoferi]